MYEFQGYTPITNKCIDLERCIKKSDLQPLENKYQELGEDSSYSLMLVRILEFYLQLDFLYVRNKVMYLIPNI